MEHIDPRKIQFKVVTGTTGSVVSRFINVRINNEASYLQQYGVRTYVRTSGLCDGSSGTLRVSLHAFFIAVGILFSRTSLIGVECTPAFS